MKELALVAWTLMLGSLLGAVYFGGLWWTVRRLPRARHPWWLYFGSLAVRVGCLLAGFYLVLNWFHWPYLVACLIGLMLARWTVTHSWVQAPATGGMEHDN